MKMKINLKEGIVKIGGKLAKKREKKLLNFRDNQWSKYFFILNLIFRYLSWIRKFNYIFLVKQCYYGEKTGTVYWFLHRIAQYASPPPPIWFGF